MSTKASAILIVSVAAVLAVAALCGVLLWRSTSSPSNAAVAFLERASQRGPAAAWRTGATDFQRDNPEERWVAFARRVKLDQYRSSNWTMRGYQGGKSYLVGAVVLGKQEKVGVRIDLVQEAGQWRVRKVQIPYQRPRRYQPRKEPWSASAGRIRI